MEEKTLIYVAGNPDAYPLEYFDKDTQTYAGVIPELLAEFSDQSTYEIVYYEADGTDHREELAQQKQVDLFSGYEAEEEQLDHAHELPLFSGEMPICSILQRLLLPPFGRICRRIWRKYPRQR